MSCINYKAAAIEISVYSYRLPFSFSLSFFPFLSPPLPLFTDYQLSLSDIIEKVQSYSACCSGQVIDEDHCEFEDSNDKERQEYSGKDFNIIDGTLLRCLLLHLRKIL